MPTSSRVFLKPFIGGLNTEGSDTDDLVLNTSEELNCTILPEQLRGRRYGFNIEEFGQWIDAGEKIVAHCLYHWNNAYEDVNFIVVQINYKVLIFEDTYPITGQQPVKTFNLSKFQTLNASPEAFDFTSVNSMLFVVGRTILPVVIEYDGSNNTFKDPILNNPKFRDFNGVDDGLAIDTCPATLTNAHLYNLINQGWDKEIYDAEHQTKTPLLPKDTEQYGLFYREYSKANGGTGTDNKGRYPANNLQWFVGKENSGKYNTTDVLNTYFGNTPAPKGHFIINYTDRSRTVASGITINKQSVTEMSWHATKITWQQPNPVYLEMYAGRANYYKPPYFTYTFNLPGSVTGKIKKFQVKIKDNVEATVKNRETIYHHIGRELTHLSNFKRSAKSAYYIFAQNFRISIIGINGSTRTVIYNKDNCNLGLNNMTGTWTTFDVNTSNTTSYKQYAVQISFPSIDQNKNYMPCLTANLEARVTETANDTPGDTTIVDGLPSNDLLQGAITRIENFGGRIFYLCGNTVLFSQTLSTNNVRYDKCYQEADPTSEEISDVVATDGGMIQLLSLGKGKNIKSFYRGVIVFGDEEVTGILSNYINLFSAESYDVVKITTAGLSAKDSVVETDNNLFYWSNHGIYMIAIDENNNISSTCITVNSIQNWYMNLNQFSKDHAVGYYDYANNRIYWFYPTTDNADKLDGCLVYDLNYNSFMPQLIDAGTVVRDVYGQYIGRIDNYGISYIALNGDVEEIQQPIQNNTVYNTRGELIGYVQDKYITDCNQTLTVNYITPTIYLRANGDIVTAGEDTVVLSQSVDSYYNRKSAGLILISDGRRFSFGDFNDREFRDFGVSPYQSYLVSRPITLGDSYFNKQTPIMQTLFKRTEEVKLKPFVLPDNNLEYYAIDTEFYRLTETTSYNTGYIINNEGYLRRMAATITYLPESLTDITITTYGFNDSLTSDDPVFTQLDTVTMTRTEALAAGGYIFESNPDTKYKSYKVAVTGTFSENNSTRLNIPVQIILADVDKSYGKFGGWNYYSTAIENPVTQVKGTDYDVDATDIGYMITVGVSGDMNSKRLVTRATTTFTNAVRLEPDDPQDPPVYDWTATVEYGSISRDIDRDNGKSSVGYPDLFPTRYYHIQFGNFQDNWTASNTLPDSFDMLYDVEYVAPKYVPFETREYEELNVAEYLAPSGNIIRMRWGWSLSPLSNRWDMMQNGYRPQKDFLYDDYVESRMHIKGRGKAFQVEIRNDDNKDFRLMGLNIITRSPQ